LRYSERVRTLVDPMAMPELVALVNDRAAIPREMDGREPAPDDPATAVADACFFVFAADGDAGRAELVTRLLDRTGVRPALVAGADRLDAAWTVDDPAQARLAAAVLALRAQLAAHPDRIGVCADEQCADVYVDQSPGGHRRFCSLTCQSRTRTAAFRQRQRAAG
jgi:predicted RNA-binding Zn ribbon-like protein